MSIQQTHEQLLALVEQFDAVCTANHIPYTLHGGSLLGAIREQGFIPWDDDVDTAMTRDAFEKLEQVLAQDDRFYLYGGIKKQFRRRGEDSLWVDIFVCDPIGTGTQRKKKLFWLTVLDIMNRDKNSIRLSHFSQYGIGKRLAFRGAYWLGKLFPRRAKVRWYTRISRDKYGGDGSRLHRSNDQYKGRKEDFPAAWMTSFRRVPFETATLSVMTHAHDMLVKCYGETYMTPVRDERNQDVHNLVRGTGKGDVQL